MEGDRQRFPLDEGTQLAMSHESDKESKEYKNSETLFKSVDKQLSDEYLDWWTDAVSEFIQMYRDAEQDGTEDAQRLRMLAAARLGQLGLNMFNFFSSAAVVIQNGGADIEACNAVCKVVSLLVERKVDGWMTRTKKSLN